MVVIAKSVAHHIEPHHAHPLCDLAGEGKEMVPTLVHGFPTNQRQASLTAAVIVVFDLLPISHLDRKVEIATQLDGAMEIANHM